MPRVPLANEETPTRASTRPYWLCSTLALLVASPPQVHVLENNAGLLERDFRVNQPFYERFGIKCGKDLNEEGVQICYCLKRTIGKRFLTKMVEGKLEEELGNTVLIVDEVRGHPADDTSHRYRSRQYLPQS